jgi:hypothetical protein
MLHSLPEANPTDFTKAHADLLRMNALYTLQKHGRNMPRRNDFRQSDLCWIFGRFYTVDVLRGGEDYRISSYGDFWKAVLGYDLTGTSISELEACGKLLGLRSVYDAVVTAHQPAYSSGQLRWPNQTSIGYERLSFPYADDTDQPAMLLIAGCWDRNLQEIHELKRLGEPQLIVDGMPIKRVA